ncbi:MAG: HAD-IA family hydrolase [Acidobacteriaceae bacterium]
MIKAVIFDLNGIFIQAPYLSDRFFSDFGVQKEIFVPRLTKVMDEVRKPDGPGFYGCWQPALNEWGIKLKEQEFLKYVFKEDRASEKMIDLARRLKASNIKVFVLSNNYRERSDFYGGYAWIHEVVDKAYYSWQTGFIKPNPEAWKLILRENNLRAEECLFFDDQDKNIDAAKSVGMPAYKFKNEEELERIIRGLVDKKIDVAGVNVDNITKQEALSKIESFVASGKPHLVTTVYSEFVVFARFNSEYRDALNSADLSLPDGVGILWAAKFLSLPLTFSSKFLKTLQAVFQLKLTLTSLIFYPSYCRTVIKEQISGSRFVWDIAGLCAKNNFSLGLVGGFDKVAEEAAKKLQEKFPQLKVSLALSGAKFDQSLVDRIKASSADILLIAYQPPQQELWLKQNLNKLNVKVAMGLGGTFDYLAGKRRASPPAFHALGLEWLWRLVTQPWRLKRMMNALPGFIFFVFRYKLSLNK